MASSLRWPDAALAGLASSMRTFASPGVLAARGEISGRPRIPVLLAAAGELGMDKTPQATDRTDPPAVVGRVAAGAYTGYRIANAPGAATAAVAAAVGSYATWRARGLVVRTTGLPDAVVAVGEDILAVGLAAVATRSGSRADNTAGNDGADAHGHAGEDGAGGDGVAASNGTPMDASGLDDRSPQANPPRSSLLRDAGVGLLAGLAGTAAMTIAQGAEFVLTDAEPSDSPAQVADLVKRRAGRGRLRRRHRRVANQGMHWLYGASWGIPYGIVAGSTSAPPELTGPAFGLCVWAAALAHEPALGLADVPWKRSPASLGSEALFHLVYGIGAGAALRALHPAA